MTALISVIVPALDASATMGRTLAALAAQEVQADYEVIVVDGGSSDGTPSLVESSGVATALLHNPGGEPASSRNMGARNATGRVLAFTDSDCEPAPDWLAAGLRAVAHADIVQGKVLPAGPNSPFDRTVTVVSEYGLYETANLFVSREAFELVGGFEAVIALENGELLSTASGESRLGDGSVTRPFGEDSWFAWRAKRKGLRTAFAEDALVYHAVFPRTIRAFVSDRWRCRYFPPLVGMIPELRTEFLYRRVFLSPPSMRFDLFLAAAAGGFASRRPVLAVLGAVPYASHVLDATQRVWWRHPLVVAAGTVAADAVTFAALARGSLRARTLVL